MKRYFKVKRSRRLRNPLSKKNYIKVAAILKHARNEITARRMGPGETIDFIAHELSDYFGADNPNFDRKRFFDATMFGKNPARIRTTARQMVKRFGKRRARRMAGEMIDAARTQRRKTYAGKLRRAINPRLKTYVVQTWNGKRWIDRDNWKSEISPKTALKSASMSAHEYAKTERVKARVVVK